MDWSHVLQLNNWSSSTDISRHTWFEIAIDYFTSNSYSRWANLVLSLLYVSRLAIKSVQFPAKMEFQQDISSASPQKCPIWKITNLRILLFGVTSYANMPACTGFRDLIHYHANRVFNPCYGGTIHSRLEPMTHDPYWVVRIDDSTTVPPRNHIRQITSFMVFDVRGYGDL